MSMYDYRESRRAEMAGYPFYALVMACMRQADDVNIKKLKFIFPNVWKELEERYNSPGGALKSKKEELKC